MANNVSSDIDIAEFYAARERIYPLALATPLIYSRSLSDLFSAQIYLKCEQFQPTGRLKFAAPPIRFSASCKNEQRIRRNGVVTASTGNHGRAVSYVAKSWGSRRRSIFLLWCRKIKSAISNWKAAG